MKAASKNPGRSTPALAYEQPYAFSVFSALSYEYGFRAPRMTTTLALIGIGLLVVALLIL
jgi:hypothetical protein